MGYVTGKYESKVSFFLLTVFLFALVYHLIELLTERLTMMGKATEYNKEHKYVLTTT